MSKYIPKTFTPEEKALLRKLYKQSEDLEQEVWELRENYIIVRDALEYLEKAENDAKNRLELVNEKIWELDPGSDFDEDEDANES